LAEADSVVPYVSEARVLVSARVNFSTVWPTSCQYETVKSWAEKGGSNELMNELKRWANFYLLMSAAAATLIGLLFVVITLGAERIVEDSTAKVGMYLTPTGLYFASVLFLAALLTFPNHTRLTASLCICVVGVAGLVYSGSFLIERDGKKNYYGLQDRIVYAVLPFAAYGLHVFGGALFFQAPQRGLTLVAAGMLSLLALAIRNSWAIAVDVVLHPGGQKHSK
jgi:hypothetical protein